MSRRYWLWDWLDENDIFSVDAAMRAVQRKKSLARLQRSAAEWEPSLTDALPGTSVIAGAGADLYSGLQCPNSDCQKNSVDKLFHRVWHYFDQIIIGDNLTHDIAHHWDADTELELTERFLTRVDVLLHIRKVGAEDLVVFREKEGNRTENWRRELRRTKITSVVEAADSVLAALRDRASVEIKLSDGVAWIKLDDPTLAWSTQSGIDVTAASRLPISRLKRFALDDWWSTMMLFLASDLTCAQELEAALGCVNRSHQSVLAKVREATPDSLAFHLDFPILEGVPMNRPGIAGGELV